MPFIANIQKSIDIGQIDNRDGYWVRGWQPKDCDSSLSATKLLPHGHENDPLYAELSSGPMLTSFNHRQNFSAPSAYATTTLVGASYKSGLTPRILSVSTIYCFYKIYESNLLIYLLKYNL